MSESQRRKAGALPPLIRTRPSPSSLFMASSNLRPWRRRPRRIAVLRFAVQSRRRIYGRMGGVEVGRAAAAPRTSGSTFRGLELQSRTEIQGKSNEGVLSCTFSPLNHPIIPPDHHRWEGSSIIRVF